jgi:hypothetical protein
MIKQQNNNLRGVAWFTEHPGVMKQSAVGVREILIADLTGH